MTAACRVQREELLGEIGETDGRAVARSTLKSAPSNPAGGQFPSRSASASAGGPVRKTTSGFGSATAGATQDTRPVPAASESGVGGSAAAVAPAMARSETAAPTTVDKQETKQKPAAIGMSAEQ